MIPEDFNESVEDTSKSNFLDDSTTMPTISFVKQKSDMTFD